MRKILELALVAAFVLPSFLLQADHNPVSAASCSGAFTDSFTSKNLTKWTFTESSANGSMSIDANRLKSASPAGGAYVGSFTTNSSFSGDFNSYINVLSQTSTTQITETSIIIRTSTANFDNSVELKAQNVGTHTNFIFSKTVGGVTSVVSNPGIGSLTNFGIALERKGANVTANLYENGFISSAGTTAFMTNNIFVTIKTQNSTSSSFTTLLDNFSLECKQSPIYRFWSNTYNKHFYTIYDWERDAVQANPNWTYEGPWFASYTSDNCVGKSEVYRFWSDAYKGHFYTISAAERDNLINNNPNWAYEGAVYCAYTAANAPIGAAVPLYRFWSDAYRGHFYTTSTAEKNNLIANNPNWAYEGIAYYVRNVQ